MVKIFGCQLRDALVELIDTTTLTRSRAKSTQSERLSLDSLEVVDFSMVGDHDEAYTKVINSARA